MSALGVDPNDITVRSNGLRRRKLTEKGFAVVAILSALLGKPTWVRPGTYHKVRGVFRQSLAMQKNVRLI